MKIQVKDFHAEKICHSGQCFRMEPINDTRLHFSLIAHGKYLEIRQETDGINVSCTEDDWDNIWKDYFDCDTDYGEIYDIVDASDPYLVKAVEFGSGIRILKQELFETIICFIISQQNNINRIRKCVRELCGRYGEERKNERGESYHVFPSPERLAACTEEELRDCNLGYRSKYIVKTSQMIAEGNIRLEQIRSMPYAEAREELMKLSGVGIKVAECICLFALHHVDAFPIDTHIQAVLQQHYPEGFPFSRYQGYAGILQQYAFYFDIYGKRQNSLSPLLFGKNDL